MGVSRKVSPTNLVLSEFIAHCSSRVTVIDASVGHVTTTLPAEGVYELGFSPLGTYIITWQRPTRDEEGNAAKNLKVWRTIDEDAGAEGQRSVVGQFVQRNQFGWNLQYTADEKLCARVVTNEVQWYESSDLKTVWNHLRVEGVTDFAVAPGNTQSVAVFVPERKVRRIPYRHTSKLTRCLTGPASCGKGFCRPSICVASVAEDLLQRRQSPAEVE